MTTGKPAQKGPNIIGAFTDFLVLVLLVGAAGGGGYYWGTIQRMAPVKSVAPGTPGALPADSTSAKPSGSKDTGTATDTSASKSSDSGKVDRDKDSSKDRGKDNSRDRDTDKDTDKDKDSSATKTKASDSDDTSTSKSKKRGDLKYWVCSSGTDYMGYTITVHVNGTPVDSFFAPGKSIDITRYVKSGDNTIRFEAKTMGDKYNKHKNDEKAVLTLRLVSGPQMQENFKKSDVVLSYSRNASESEDYNDTKHFDKD